MSEAKPKKWTINEGVVLDDVTGLRFEFGSNEWGRVWMSVSRYKEGSEEITSRDIVWFGNGPRAGELSDGCGLSFGGDEPRINKGPADDADWWKK